MKLKIFLYLLVAASGAYLKGAAQSNLPNLSETEVPGSGNYYLAPPEINSSHDLNYIRVMTPKRAIYNEGAVSGSSAANDVSQVISYTDGSNQAYQTVVKNVSTKNGHQHRVYLSDNRPIPEQYSYLPFVTQSDFVSNPFSGQAFYYYNKYGDDGNYAYSKTERTSNSGEISAMGYAPGKSAVGQGRGSKARKITNFASEVRYWQVDDSGEPYTTVYYPEYQLFGSETKMPNEADGSIAINSPASRVYKDKDDNIVLKMVTDSFYYYNEGMMQYHKYEWQKTYYVYSKMGQLMYIIPPKAVALLEANGWNMTATIKNNLCFQYQYDDKGRPIASKQPGEDGFTEVVYDRKDRAVMSRNLKEAELGEWSVVFYDAQGRTHATSVYSSSSTRASMQATMDSWTGGSAADLFYYLGTDAGELAAPTETAVSGNTMMSYTWYDDYTQADPGGTIWTAFGTHGFLSPELITTVYAETPERSKRTYGMVTGGKVRILASPNAAPSKLGTWRSSVNYYDDKGRVIHSHTMDYATNPAAAVRHHFNSVQYNFSGQPLVSKQVMFNNNSTDGSTTHTELTRNVYEDATGNLKHTYHKIGSGGWVLQATYTYDELGRIQRKSQGAGGEVQDFSYDVSGRLTGINKEYAETGLKGGFSRSFGQSFRYDFGFTMPRYDGRISGMIWRGAQATNAANTQKHAYGYHYDLNGRLKEADYRVCYEYLGLGNTWTNNLQDYSVANLRYDKNSNIVSMKQRGVKPGVGPVDMDDMSYEYEASGISNRLSSIHDDGESDYGAGDFQDGFLGTDYEYDANGNLSKDLNKGISSITYTRFNKPLVVSFSNGNSIEYSYDAAGNKIQELTIDPLGESSARDYVGNFIYENDELQYASTSEGRSVYNIDDQSFREEYYVKDHLGNVRSVIDVIRHPMIEYLATYEIASAGVEGLVFDYLNEIRDNNPASPNIDDQESGRLNAADSDRRIGTSLLMHVMAGDAVSLEVNNLYDGYDHTKDNEIASSEMMDAIIGALSTGSGGWVGSESHNPELVNEIFSSENWSKINNLTDSLFSNNTAPKAGLYYVLFDEGMQVVTSFIGAYQVNGNGDWATIGTTAPLEIPQNGYLAVYLSSASDLSATCYSCGDVFFDLLRVQLTKGNLLEETHYYPHGLPIKSISSESHELKENRHKYQGNEYNKTLGLNWMDFQARQYDPQIGRFLGVDPLAAAQGQEVWSPYAAMGNNPESMIDPNGLMAIKTDVFDHEGETGSNNFGSSMKHWLAMTGGAIEFYGGGGGGDATPGANAFYRNMLPMEAQARFDMLIANGYSPMGAYHMAKNFSSGEEEDEDASGKYGITTNSFGVWAKDLDKKTPTDQSMLDGQAYEKVDPAEVEAKAVVIKSTSLMPEGQERFAPAQVDDFEGFWGKVSWVLSPNVGRGKYDWHGNYVGIAPIGGVAPDIGMGKSSISTSIKVSGWIKRSVYKSLDPSIQKKMVSAIEKGIVSPTGSQGIIRLTSTEAAATGFTHKIKILGKGGDIRIYGNQSGNGHIFFEFMKRH